jgi:imidazolonepropionase-like amidohydrolase
MMHFYHLFIVLAAIVHLVQACAFHGDHKLGPDFIAELRQRDISLPPRYSAPANISKTAITNVRIFDGQCMLPPSTVIISSAGLITTNPHNIETTIDGTGKFLIPGLIESHSHLGSPTDMEALASYGVTTAFNMACFSYPFCHSLQNLTGLTQLITAGLPGQGTGSLHARLFGTPVNETISSPDQAVDFVNWTFGNGSAFYKITAEASEHGPSQETQNALVSAAHALGKKTTTHASDWLSYRQAIASGTDSIQHTAPDQLMTEDMIQGILDNGQFVTATMAILKGLIANQTLLNIAGISNATNEILNANVKMMFDAGIPILAGTDSRDAVSLVALPFGKTLHDELGNLVGAGLTEVQALRAATSVSAKMHELNDRGEIRVGLRADLLLLGSDPLVNISNSRDIVKVWVGGVEVRNITTLK